MTNLTSAGGTCCPVETISSVMEDISEITNSIETLVDSIKTRVTGPYPVCTEEAGLAENGLFGGLKCERGRLADVRTLLNNISDSM